MAKLTRILCTFSYLYGCNMSTSEWLCELGVVTCLEFPERNDISTVHFVEHQILNQKDI